MESKVLILGCTGKLGSSLLDVFGSAYAAGGASRPNFEATDPDSVRRILDHDQPNVVLNAVALQGIDYCENHREEAFRLNAEFPGELAAQSRRRGFALVHFSTECVFDGGKREAYTEDDEPAPLNAYGASKLEGERRVRAGTDRHYVVRLTMQFGTGGRGGQFAERMIAAARAERQVRVADDVVTSPTYNRDVAGAVRDLVASERPFGVYHIANEGKASLYEFMDEVLRRLGLEARLERGSYKDFPGVGRKNLYTPLRSVKMSPLRPWRDALREYCERLA